MAEQGNLTMRLTITTTTTTTDSDSLFGPRLAKKHKINKMLPIYIDKHINTVGTLNKISKKKKKISIQQMFYMIKQYQQNKQKLI